LGLTFSLGLSNIKKSLAPKPNAVYWIGINAKDLSFSKIEVDASSKDSEAKSFWADFLDIFGVANKQVAKYVHEVKAF
jgi:hypothetical protein